MGVTPRDLLRGDREQTKDAAYTAIGFAILGFQRLRYHRRELGKQLAAGGRDLTDAKAAEISGVADIVDSALRQWSESPLTHVSEPASLALSVSRHLREQLLEPWLAQANQPAETLSTATSTTSTPATDDT
ncbi:MAG: hypothetical protein P8N50_00385 [Actinomycetota bacterium]|jgi:hypothetical protein|nr:hypothetical protein [Actinomycetota bacterium]